MYTFIKKNLLLIGVVACLYPLQVSAQDKLSVHAKADFVSDYVWRGADQQSGCSVQPSLTLGYAGFSLNVWGSQSLTKWEEGGSKEWDINLGYTYRNLTATLSDYWWSGINQPYGHYKNSHYFEATLAYCFSDSFPLSLSWSTMFAGADKNEKGNLQASTYLSASYPFRLPADIVLTPAVGFTPWKGMYHHKAAFTDVSLKVSKEVSLSNHLTIPLGLWKGKTCFLKMKRFLLRLRKQSAFSFLFYIFIAADFQVIMKDFEQWHSPCFSCNKIKIKEQWKNGIKAIKFLFRETGAVWSTIEMFHMH